MHVGLRKHETLPQVCPGEVLHAAPGILRWLCPSDFREEF